jgi:hypothetical protein
MLWALLVGLLVLWFLGLLGHVGGGMLHLFLLLAAVALMFNAYSDRWRTL